MEAQLYTRRHAVEAQEYLNDLLKWQSAQREKDERCNARKAVNGTESGLFAPIDRSDRCSTPSQFISEPQGDQEVSADLSERREVGSFFTPPPRAQDRVRSDSSKSESTVATDGSFPINQASTAQVAPIRSMPVRDAGQSSAMWKDCGNACFKRGDWVAAKEAYAKSIEAEKTSVGYANRAMASLKLGEAAEAEQDCTRSLALDPGYLKAWQRRAAARTSLGHLLDAIDDLEFALRLEPTSKALAAERSILMKKCRAGIQSAPIHMKIQGISKAMPPHSSVPAAEPAAVPGAIASTIASGEVPAEPSQQKQASMSKQIDAAASSQPAVELVTRSRKDSTAVEALIGGPADSAKELAPPQRGKTIGIHSDQDQRPAQSLQKNSAQQQNKVELKGGFLGSALAGKAAKRAAETEAQPAINGPRQQQSSAAYSLGHTKLEARSGLQSGFLGKALAGKFKAEAAVAKLSAKLTTEAGTAHKPGQTSESTAQQRWAGHAAENGTAALSLGQQTLQRESEAWSAPVAKAPAPSKPAESATKTLSAAPIAEGTPVALGAVQRALPAKQAALRAPTSGTEFEMAWKSLGSDAQRQAAYLSLLLPASLPALFKQALTGPLLSSMLTVVLSQLAIANPSFSVELLSALSKVPRFELTVMCLPTREKQQLKELWEAAALLMRKPDAAAIQGLRKSYRL